MRGLAWVWVGMCTWRRWGGVVFAFFGSRDAWEDVGVDLGQGFGEGLVLVLVFFFFSFFFGADVVAFTVAVVFARGLLLHALLQGAQVACLF